MIVLWIIAVVLLALSLWILLGNLWITFGGFFFKKKKPESLLPFVGGIVGAVGLLLLPISQTRHFWWVPLVIDLGCGPMLIAVLIDQVKKKLNRE
jgi:hypothetical protein